MVECRWRRDAPRCMVAVYFQACYEPSVGLIVRRSSAPEQQSFNSGVATSKGDDPVRLRGLYMQADCKWQFPWNHTLHLCLKRRPEARFTASRSR